MDIEITSLITAFTFIFLAELGDKTQLTTIMLSSRSSAISVFSGAMLAFFLIDGLSAIIGGKLPDFIDYKWINLISGLIFIFLGFLSFFSKNEKISSFYFSFYRKRIWSGRSFKKAFRSGLVPGFRECTWF
ncbi:MAG: TMEM165/GDT1 family protein [Nitrososphaerota archaeon]